MTDWYLKPTQEALADLNTDPDSGLTADQARQRLAEYGSNELIERGAKSPWLILWEQLTGLMVVILIIAAIISAFVGEPKDAVAILAIVVLNALLGFSQEYRAERALAALKQMAVPLVKVRRDGRVQELSARELVPGDLVLLEAGVLLPADGRLVEAVNLRVEEAALTGESEPVEKSSQALTEKVYTVGDRHNMVYTVSYTHLTLPTN